MGKESLMFSLMSTPIFLSVMSYAIFAFKNKNQKKSKHLKVLLLTSVIVGLLYPLTSSTYYQITIDNLFLNCIASILVAIGINLIIFSIYRGILNESD